MSKARTVLASLALAVTLSACAGQGQRGPSTQLINRVLASAPGAAQPSTIVAIEVAYARDAKERGLPAASADTAAPGALVHGRSGAALFDPSARTAPIAATWNPRAIVMSCDGELALSMGRFADQDGQVGNYVTTWARQGNGGYKWTYHAAGLDNPQPIRVEQQGQDGNIVVTAIDSIEGLVATCPRGDETVPPPPAIGIGDDGASAAQLSRDGTMRWQWQHRPDGTRTISADYFYEGAWVNGIEESLASPPEG
ncbi:hypothetical protein [Qipengyuania sp. ASV99]|uniref:hypothetical protein n=1 Tax=Qipengyuania sp. ASV99 TaxID=3399681 RepID=UPI003A4C59C8